MHKNDRQSAVSRAGILLLITMIDTDDAYCVLGGQFRIRNRSLRRRIRNPGAACPHAEVRGNRIYVKQIQQAAQTSSLLVVVPGMVKYTCQYVALKVGPVLQHREATLSVIVCLNLPAVCSLAHFPTLCFHKYQQHLIVSGCFHWVYLIFIQGSTKAQLYYSAEHYPLLFTVVMMLSKNHRNGKFKTNMSQHHLHGLSSPHCFCRCTPLTPVILLSGGTHSSYILHPYEYISCP